MASTKGHRW